MRRLRPARACRHRRQLRRRARAARRPSVAPAQAVPSRVASPIARVDEGPQGRGAADAGASPSCRRRTRRWSFVAGPGGRRDAPARPGRDASARRAGAAGRALRRRGRDRTTPPVGYRETIRDTVNVRGRHKKQSGGHGQFGDVVHRVAPLPRGEGFAFDETVHGGAVPRQYFSSVEEGVRDALERGPARLPGRRRGGDADRRLLSHGRFLRHGVPRGGASRDGGGAGRRRGPVLLEPILAVEIAIPPSERCRRPRRSSRRGAARSSAIDARPGWDGWDVLKRADPGSGNGRPDRRAALGDGGRRHLHRRSSTIWPKSSASRRTPSSPSRAAARAAPAH